jgi:RNA polymerase primary sigma factor
MRLEGRYVSLRGPCRLSVPHPSQTADEEYQMMTLGSPCLDPDRVSAATGAVPLGLPDAAPLEPSGRSPVGQSRTPIEMRARRQLETRIEFVPHSSFEDPATHPTILGPMPSFSAGQDVPRGEPAAGLSPFLEGLYGDPLLTREQEVHLFRKMNFLKHQASRLLGAIDPVQVKAAGLDLVEALQEEALAVRNQIIRGNLRLVVSVAKQLIGHNQDFAELVSDGYVALMRAVEKFDFSRDYKFSTYASWVIINNLLRDSARDRLRDPLVTGYGAILEAAPDRRNDESRCEMEQGWCQEVIRGMLGRLNDRERMIIVSRFGLEGARQKTLNQLGKELGITKERVRQIEARARVRLREIAEAQQPDLLDF